MKSPLRSLLLAFVNVSQIGVAFGGLYFVIWVLDGAGSWVENGHTPRDVSTSVLLSLGEQFGRTGPEPSSWVAGAASLVHAGFALFVLVVAVGAAVNALAFERDEGGRVSGLTTAELCSQVGSLSSLVARFPDLARVIRHYSNVNFVPVPLNTCSSPQDAHGYVLRDRVVFGLFFVDRRDVARGGSEKAIRQDYFVVWTDGSGEMRYYSGAPRAWKREGRLYWHNIDEFCSDGFAGPGNCYGCKVRDGVVRPKHWYRVGDPELALDPREPWRLAFELAVSVAITM